MPRVYSSANDPLDFCEYCFPDEDAALGVYGDVGAGPDERGNCFAYEADHPDYEYEDYLCTECQAPLTEDDN